jgi:hypothetical protein
MLRLSLIDAKRWSAALVPELKFRSNLIANCLTAGNSFALFMKGGSGRIGIFPWLTVTMWEWFAAEKVAFPMARHGTIFSLRGTLADRDGIDDVSQSAHGDAAFNLAHLPPGAQICHPLFFQNARRLNKEAAINRFVQHVHLCIGWKLPLQPASDLLRRALQRKFLGNAPS